MNKTKKEIIVNIVWRYGGQVAFPKFGVNSLDIF